MPNRIKLGTIVQDRVTGLQGVAVCRTEYLTGCTRVGVQPKGTQKDGRPFDSTYIDEPMLDIVDSSVIQPTGPLTLDEGRGDPGGPHNEPTDHRL